MPDRKMKLELNFLLFGIRFSDFSKIALFNLLEVRYMKSCEIQ